MREFTFYFETKKETGKITVKAETYSTAISAMKKQKRGIIFFKAID